MLFVKKYVGVLLFLIISGLSFTSVHADELVKQIQQDLNSLGYSVGYPDGEMGVKTQMAIGKFQKEHNLPIDGKPSVAVAIAISEAKESGVAPSATTTQVDPATTELTSEQLASQEACLKQKAEEAQSAKKSSMFGALTDMAGTMLSSFGQHELAMMLGQAKTVAQQAETVSKLAKDLGITEQQVQECLASAQ